MAIFHSLPFVPSCLRPSVPSPYNLPMPELPEVERVRQSLACHVIGRRIVSVIVRRAQVVDFGTLAARTASAMQQALLVNRTITALDRRGKQIAIITDGDDGAALCIHLGMTGSVIHQSLPLALADEKHAHLLWHLDNDRVFFFHDPRRFGGIWCYPTFNQLITARWNALGDDALTISPQSLHEKLHRTDRHLKAVLLDQSVIAGLGNIYVDELLFARGLHPTMRASKLKLEATHELVTTMRDLLHRAIHSGGSSLRNYVDANGQTGGFQFQHLVYGRAGKPCVRCDALLKTKVVAGRTTVFCARCQKR